MLFGLISCKSTRISTDFNGGSADFNGGSADFNGVWTYFMEINSYLN